MPISIAATIENEASSTVTVDALDLELWMLLIVSCYAIATGTIDIIDNCVLPEPKAFNEHTYAEKERYMDVALNADITSVITEV